jgi:hypothetical protein
VNTWPTMAPVLYTLPVCLWWGCPKQKHQHMWPPKGETLVRLRTLGTEPEPPSQYEGVLALLSRIISGPRSSRLGFFGHLEAPSLG